MYSCAAANLARARTIANIAYAQAREYILGSLFHFACQRATVTIAGILHWAANLCASSARWLSLDAYSRGWSEGFISLFQRAAIYSRRIRFWFVWYFKFKAILYIAFGWNSSLLQIKRNLGNIGIISLKLRMMYIKLSGIQLLLSVVADAFRRLGWCCSAMNG